MEYKYKPEDLDFLIFSMNGGIELKSKTIGEVLVFNSENKTQKPFNFSELKVMLIFKQAKILYSIWIN